MTGLDQIPDRETLHKTEGTLLRDKVATQTDTDPTTTATTD